MPFLNRMDTLDSLIDRALQLPSNAIAFSVGRSLAALFPGRAVLECASCSFDVNRFVNAGLAHVRPWPESGHAQVVTSWRGWNPELPGDAGLTGKTGLSKTIQNAWVEIEWQNHRIGLLQLSWTEYIRTRTASFLI